MVYVKEKNLNNIWFGQQVKGGIPNFKDKNVNGLDTETFNGKVTLLSVVGDNIEKTIMPENVDEILKFLIMDKISGCHNFFFNMKYDRNAIIKMLPNKNIDELINHSLTFYNGYRLNLIGNRGFKITKIKIVGDKIKTSRSSFFSDIAIFYQCGSLEHTVKKVLNEKYKKGVKIGGGVFFKDQVAYVKRKNSEKYDYYSYEDIIKYCLEDSLYTYKLAKNLTDSVNEIVKVRYYYSPASISKAFLKQNFPNGYQFQINDLQQFALNSYNGGRFEVLSKGWFDNIYMCDINSAYPYHISQLYFPDGVTKKSCDYEPDSIYSYFKIDVDINDSFRFSPFKFCCKNLNELLIFPTGIFRDVYVCKSELEILDKLDVRYHIKEGVHMFNNDPVLWIDGIKDLYEKRLKLKKKNDRLQHVYKLILNSLYGVCIQLNKGKRHITEWSDAQENNPLNQFITIEDKKMVMVQSFWKAGQWFNPVLACEITARTRNQLYNDFHKYEDDIIMLATDSVCMTRPIPYKNSEKLGEYKITKRTSGVILGNGIYEFLNGKKGYRGLISDQKIRLKKMFENNFDTELELTKTRPKGLKEGRPKEYVNIDPNELINMFLPYKKEIVVDMDRKRLWDREFNNFDEVLKDSIDSRPIHF